MELQLFVGPTAYRVVVADREIFNSEGEPMEGCAIEHRRLIVLSRNLELHRRQEIARHEFFHCWLFHVPQPRNEEENAQFHQLVARQFEKDIEAAGGSDVLLNMKPTRVVIGRPGPERADAIAAKEPMIDRPRNSIACGICSALIHVQSIHTSAATLNEDTGKHQVERWMQCDVCGAVHLWHEFAGAGGTPLGTFCPTPPPKVMQGTEASAWLTERAEVVTM